MYNKFWPKKKIRPSVMPQKIIDPRCDLFFLCVIYVSLVDLPSQDKSVPVWASFKSSAIHRLNFPIFVCLRTNRAEFLRCPQANRRKIGLSDIRK
jgi:hypothetical protein